jgi:DNA repair protein RecN (Recombination protein N)
LDELSERLRAAAIEAGELAGELRSYAEGASATGAEPLSGHAGPPTLEALEERLALIERLMRKHGGSVGAMRESAAAARARRDQLAGAEVALANTEQRMRGAEERLADHVRALRAARRAAAPRLERGVREQLAALAMGEASFEVLLSEREPGPAGADLVEFMLATNPGVPAGPVREIASGGELSRIMLALSSACARGVQPRRDRRGASTPGPPEQSAQETATLAFDELDAGIGGQTARAVGTQLRELARDRQLLCITHLPQVASLAERHFSIVKDASVRPARTSVLELSEPQVVAELVRMMGADSGDSTARRHARDLLRAA